MSRFDFNYNISETIAKTTVHCTCESQSTNVFTSFAEAVAFRTDGCITRNICRSARACSKKKGITSADCNCQSKLIECVGMFSFVWTSRVIKRSIYNSPACHNKFVMHVSIKHDIRKQSPSCQSAAVYAKFPFRRSASSADTTKETQTMVGSMQNRRKSHRQLAAVIAR